MEVAAFCAAVEAMVSFGAVGGRGTGGIISHEKRKNKSPEISFQRMTEKRDSPRRSPQRHQPILTQPQPAAADKIKLAQRDLEALATTIHWTASTLCYLLSVRFRRFFISF